MNLVWKVIGRYLDLLLSCLLRYNFTIINDSKLHNIEVPFIYIPSSLIKDYLPKGVGRRRKDTLEGSGNLVWDM